MSTCVSTDDTCLTQNRGPHLSWLVRAHDKAYSGNTTAAADKL